MSLLSCTVVVATFNRSRDLSRLLAALASQHTPPGRFEVIVVDDGSTDDTYHTLSSLVTPFRLRTFRQRNHGPGAARNAAIEAAASELIVTVDDDVVPAPDLLERHIEAHEAAEGNIVAIGAMVRHDDNRLTPWAEWELAALRKQYEAMVQGLWAPTPRQLYTANVSVRRCVLLEAGLFDPLFRRAEDVELGYRLQDIGVGFRFLPNAIVYHQPNRSYKAWRRMAWLYGYYDVLMWRNKKRAHIKSLVGHEFGLHRHPSIQMLARVLVGRGALTPFLASTGALARLAHRAGLRSVSEKAYSGIFNLLYWQGVADALGGRKELRTWLELPRERRAALARAERDA